MHRTRGTAVVILSLAALMSAAGCATNQGSAGLPQEAWRGLHVYLSDREDLPVMIRALEEQLGRMG